MLQSITTVTQKGQVTISKPIRDNVGINIYDKVEVAVSGGRIILTPQKSILDIAPLAIASKGKTALKAREFMEKNYKPR